MRRTAPLLALLLTAPLALAPLAAATHLPVCPPVDYRGVGDGNGVVLMPLGAPLLGFLPGECVILGSGHSLVFASVDLFGHSVGDSNCFYNYYSPTNPTNLVRTYTFTYDGAQLAVNGVPCTPYLGVATPQAVTFPYFCSSHAAMRGTITVAAP